MANYRKQIKITPEVHLNLSKEGNGTSIDPEGAKSLLEDTDLLEQKYSGHRFVQSDKE